MSRSVYMLYLTAVGGMCVVMGLLSLYLLTEVLRVGTNYWVTLWSNDAAHRRRDSTCGLRGACGTQRGSARCPHTIAVPCGHPSVAIAA